MVTVYDVAEQVIRLATLFPDNVYTRPEGQPFCKYGSGSCTNGSTGCIVGQALKALGFCNVDLDDISIGDAESAMQAAGIPFDQGDETVDWIVRVQVVQDTGKTWGESLAHAGQLPQIVGRYQ